MKSIKLKKLLYNITINMLLEHIMSPLMKDQNLFTAQYLKLIVFLFESKDG